MSELTLPIERIGDGLNNELFAGQVADSIPFLQYAIASVPHTAFYKTPTDNPDHWLAVPNCEAACRALDVYLMDNCGYESELLINERTPVGDHVILQTDVGGEKIWVDPTALQFLQGFDISVESRVDSASPDFLGDLLPPERILIFRPEAHEDVVDWMTAIVGRYWQTNISEMYASGELEVPPTDRYALGHGLYSPGQSLATVTQEQIRDEFNSVYSPAKFSQFMEPATYDYMAMYMNWLDGVPPHADLRYVIHPDEGSRDSL